MKRLEKKNGKPKDNAPIIDGEIKQGQIGLPEDVRVTFGEESEPEDG